MGKSCVVVLAALLALSPASGQDPRWGRGPGSPYSYGPYGQPSTELTIEQQRKLGLSEEQIRKIAELRRDLERERAKLDEQLKAASAAAVAANAEVSRISAELRSLTTTRLQKVYDSVLTEAQRKTLAQQRLGEQARNWLRGYQQWLKLTDAQMEDITGLLVPVFEKYARMEDETAAARERLADLRRAEKPDIVAIEKAEKEVDDLARRNIYQQRQDELMQRMRAGLMPDQAEKLGQIHRR